jgi:hypothetical protein
VALRHQRNGLDPAQGGTLTRTVAALRARR